MSAVIQDVAAQCEVRVDYAALTGESPVWSALEQRLYWIDIQQPALHRFDPASGRDEHWLLPAQIGCYALDPEGTRVILGLRPGIFEFSLRTGALQRLAAAPYDPALFRFNDGGCDSMGRFWLGTMFDPVDKRHAGEKARGQYHSYTESTGLVAHSDAAVIANGVAWDSDYRRLYIAHSEEGVIYAFDYDITSGQPGARRVFATVPPKLGVPDGGAVDAEGGYWSAINGGGRLRRFHADGRHDRDLLLPVSKPTMCAFGGPHLDTLYVTSQSDGLTDEQRAAQPLAGKLLSFTPGVRGLPTAAFGAVHRI